MRLMILLALLLVSGSLSAQTQGAIKRVRHVSRFELAVACIKKYEGLHGPKHHPYVGYALGYTCLQCGVWKGDEKPDVCQDAKWQQKHLS